MMSIYIGQCQKCASECTTCPFQQKSYLGNGSYVSAMNLGVQAEPYSSHGLHTREITKVADCMFKVIKGEEKALEEYYEKLNVLEDGIKNSSLVTNIEEKNIGVLDIMIAHTLGAYKAQEEVFGVKTLDQEKIPLLYSWVTSLIKLPIVKEGVPPHDKVVAFLQYLKNTVFKAPGN